MMKLKVKAKAKEYWLIVKVKVASEYVLNTNQSDLLLTKYNYGFFKLESAKKNKLEFIGPIGISIFERLKKTLSEYDFFLIIEQIIVAARKIEKIGLSRNNIILDLNYVFINESTKELSFIYLPIATPHGGANINSFIELKLPTLKSGFAH